jgi:hypothetical protein
MIAGLLYISRQVLHPADTLASVGSAQWTVVQLFSIAMGILAVIGLTGLYAKQAHKTGILGFVGYVLLSAFFSIATALYFVEAFVFPVLVGIAPQYVEGLQGLVNSQPSGADLGAFPIAYAVVGISYLLGGILFGISIFRAGVFPRWAGGLLAIGALITILNAVIPHPIDRALALPVSVSMVWLGWSLFAPSKLPAS